MGDERMNVPCVVCGQRVSALIGICPDCLQAMGDDAPASSLVVPVTERQAVDAETKVGFRYEGQPDYKNNPYLVHVYTYKGHDYRVSDQFMGWLAELHSYPQSVIDQILFVARMRHNPD